MPLASRIGRPGLIGTAARTAVVVGTAQATTNAMGRRQADQQQPGWDAHQADAAQPATAPPTAPPAAPAGNGAELMAHLQQLGELHASGLLDDAEFSAAKAKLLA